MKKFFSYLGWILLLAVIVAAFTATGKEQFRKYITDKVGTEQAINPNVNEVPFKFLGVKLFSFYSVSYYRSSGLTLQQQAGNSPAIAAVKATSGMVTENYLGVYNSFWKW